MKQTIVLAILDGWGIGQPDESNPIYITHPKTIDEIERNFPAGALHASGIMIGLPWEEEGNSEVGHLTIGSGKIIYQHFPKISLNIESGDFFTNTALKGAFLHAQEKEGAVHLVGLLTKGNVHASLPHLSALIQMAAKEHCTKLYLHLITDGRDSPPESAGELLHHVQKMIEEFGVGEMVSVVGRYFAMNRDEHWDRTAKAYTLLTRENIPPQKFEEVAARTYARGMNDEFIDPSVVSTAHPIHSNDSIIFFNFREDSMRQITQAFLDPAFDKFPVTHFENLYIATMTQYHDAFPAHVAFPNETVEHPLGKVLADNGKMQLRLAETQKYAHVTYFFNGLREQAFPNEYRVLIPSLDLPHPEGKPEMRAAELTERAIIALHENTFDFIVVNYANADIIAHTGNYNATIEAIQTIDRELAKLISAVLDGNHILLITSDHGNAEVLLDNKTGEPETRHDTSPVPIYLIGKEYKKKTPLLKAPKLTTIGLLSDIAPTILELMHIQKPEDMTGQSLLDQLR
ncbi:MAG: 2,3-bisphosphoglycerate-independent phosphoglycerate mutase [Candidatus Paceibacterota bacterium]|jgi:2,3-bisphosphoglycerate-independent phosphoglycerate mutase